MDNTICMNCGSENTRCLPELANDSLDGLEICVVCDDCGNTGVATFRPPADVRWDKTGDDEGE